MDGIDFSGLLSSIERAGGYAALFALFGIGLFVLANKQMNQQAKRSAEREAETEQRHLQEIEQERASAQEHRSDKLLLLATQEKLGIALQELSGVMKGALAEQREARRDIAELRREVVDFTLPKRNTARKPQAAKDE